MNPVTDKPLRRDAERNRQRILDAAAELFAERGLGVTLNEIARHAGVGVGTVYRRFPDKEQLVDSLLEQKIGQLVELMEIALADPDPWHGLTGYFESALALQSGNLAIKDMFLNSPDGSQRIARVRARLQPLGSRLVAKAQAAGALRADLSPSDVPLLMLMMSPLIDGGRRTDPELWRRFLPILLQGLRAVPEPPAPLEHPPLPFGSLDTAMSSAWPEPR